MSSFQFEGQIYWNQQEDRRGRTLFCLAAGFIVMGEFDSAFSYLNQFSKVYIVYHDPTVPRSKVTGLILRHT